MGGRALQARTNSKWHTENQVRFRTPIIYFKVNEIFLQCLLSALIDCMHLLSMWCGNKNNNNINNIERERNKTIAK